MSKTRSGTAPKKTSVPSASGGAEASFASPKIQQLHLNRMAIVYIRQSTPQQVIEHRESTARQYAFVERAVALGWSRHRIEVIDEDQGQSGAFSAGRKGFQQLLSEVSSDSVGIVFGIELSRLARSCKDSHVLFDLCSIYNTLLADADGIYDASDYNDRLLLGLKATMSEAELHVMRSRMYHGLCNKAERGEVLNHPPIGYVRTPGGDFAMDPDEQVRKTVRMIFDRFARWGSVAALLKSLARDGVQIPVRPHFGEDRGDIQWRRPNRVTLLNMLRHPIYAGAYRWGHRQVDRKKKIPGRPTTGRTFRQHTECRVLIRDRFEAYITWDEFEQNQRKLTENGRKGHFLAPPGRGVSMLAGLLQCGRCGRNMTVTYSGDHLRYACQRGAVDYGEALCQSLSGSSLDEAIGRLLITALQPASLELSMAAAADVAKERHELDIQWRQRLKRAEYATRLAFRQYNAVDPDNRLVAAELERRWEERLREQEQLESDYRRFEQSRPRELTPGERDAIFTLSNDIEGLWRSEHTTNEDRQMIARTLLERLVVTVEDDSDQVEVEVRWAGGFMSRFTHFRPVPTYDQLSRRDELLQRADQLQREGKTLVAIAEQLNREGYRPPKRAKTFNDGIVGRILRRYCAHTGNQRAAPRDRTYLNPNEWWLSDLAAELKMPVATLHRWQRVGWVSSRKVMETGGRWAVYADKKELKRLRKLRGYRRGWGETKTPAELTTPTNHDR